MIHIKFKDVLKSKPYSNSNYKIPEVAGIYIYGLLLDINSGKNKIEKKFCPLAVGESGMKRLRERLNDEKYDKYKSGGAGLKELFDFSHKTYTRSMLKEIYDDMRVYDLHLNDGDKLIKLIDIKHTGGLKNLIYFQDFNFFNHLCETPIIRKNDNKSHPVAISELRKINKGVSPILADKIEETKTTYKDRFYFVLAFDEQTDVFKIKRDRENIESSTKFTLQEKNIFTTEKHIKKDLPKIHIDLSEIEDILIDL